MNSILGPVGRRKVRTAAALLLAMFVTLSGAIFGMFPAKADVPTVAITEPFKAPLCEGTTDANPEQAEGAVRDLSLVFGKRLDAYNQGKVVPLYGISGRNAGESPPVCGVRHVEGIGAVSEWMYCTDLSGQVCAETGADGGLVGGRGTAMDFPERLEGNRRLTDDQEKIIS